MCGLYVCDVCGVYVCVCVCLCYKVICPMFVTCEQVCVHVFHDFMLKTFFDVAFLEV